MKFDLAGVPKAFFDDFTGISLDLILAAMSINWLSKSFDLFSQSQYSKRSNLIGMPFFKTIFQLAYKLLRDML